jgi:MYXO-CTERM domain-containing protein
MKNLRSILLTGLCLFYGATTSASAAAFTVFNFTFSGVAEGNTAVATGQITLDPVMLSNGFNPLSPVVSGLSLTVSGAAVAADNGTYGLADYEEIYWADGGVTLNFNSELVGQSDWGVEYGGFGLLNDNMEVPQSTSSRLFRAGDDVMRLTSFAPAAVPEPSRALLGALGVLGLVLRRRRSC